jgi:uncharacterized protein YxeA
MKMVLVIISILVVISVAVALYVSSTNNYPSDPSQMTQQDWQRLYNQAHQEDPQAFSPSAPTYYPNQ